MKLLVSNTHAASIWLVSARCCVWPEATHANAYRVRSLFMMPMLQEWLMDRRGRDQFIIRYGDETEVCWNDHQKQLAEQVLPYPLEFPVLLYILSYGTF